MSFPFIGEPELDRLGLPPGDERRSVLRLANPLSAEEPAMTTTLLPGLLKALARNAGRGATSAALFESATVTLPHEWRPRTHLRRRQAAQRGRDRRPRQGASAPAAAPGAGLGGGARAARLVGRRPRDNVGRRRRRGAGRRRGGGPRCDGALHRTRAVAPGSLRGGVGRRRGDRPCRRAASEGLRCLRRAGADRRRRARPRPAARAGAGRDRCAVVLGLPAGQGGRGARGRRGRRSR